MTSWLPDGTAEWHGRPVATRIADAAPRHRAVLTGLVGAIVVHRQRPGRRPLHPGAWGAALDALLDDGTGTITLRWLGRESVGGVVAGATLQVEGTVSSESGRLLILNPLYHFAAPSPQAARGAWPASPGDAAAVPATGLLTSCADSGQVESSTS